MSNVILVSIMLHLSSFSSVLAILYDGKLKLSSSKCIVSKFLSLHYYNSYTIDDNLLPAIDSTTDLGVIMDSRMTFKLHTDISVHVQTATEFLFYITQFIFKRRAFIDHKAQ